MNDKTKKVYGNIPGLPLSGAVRAGDYVFVSGQIPVGDDGKIVDGDVAAQTRIVMDRIVSLLREAECEMSDVIKCTCWLENTKDFQNFNAVYSQYFPKDPPARATVEAKLMVDAKVEVEAIAWKPI